jgi:hypothetical protein
MLLPSINKSLDELVHLLRQLSQNDYVNPCAELSNASIGEHCRHIIELFTCLEHQYENSVVNYDNRARNNRIQTDTEYAVFQIKEIQKGLGRENKILRLQQCIEGEEIDIQTNYYRELLYNLEHCIHHQALIKVAVIKLDYLQITESFGVAPSTIEFRKKCVL